MDGGAWWATVHGVAKSRTRLSKSSLPLNKLGNPHRNNARMQKPDLALQYFTAVEGSWRFYMLSNNMIHDPWGGV